MVLATVLFKQAIYMQSPLIHYKDTVNSIFNFSNVNPSIDLSKITRIGRARDNPHNPHIAMLYFYGAHKQILRIWFYNSTSMRDKELEIISKKYPGLTDK